MLTGQGYGVAGLIEAAVFRFARRTGLYWRSQRYGWTGSSSRNGLNQSSKSRFAVRSVFWAGVCWIPLYFSSNNQRKSVSSKTSSMKSSKSNSSSPLGPVARSMIA